MALQYLEESQKPLERQSLRDPGSHERFGPGGPLAGAFILGDLKVLTQS
jgi:hypothetical protein